MSKLNTKTVSAKTSKPDYKNSPTPQEHHMENVEKGYVATDYMTTPAEEPKRYEVIDGKRYRVFTL